MRMMKENRIIETTTAEGNKTVFTYNAAGWLISTTDTYRLQFGQTQRRELKQKRSK